MTRKNLLRTDVIRFDREFPQLSNCPCRDADNSHYETHTRYYKRLHPRVAPVGSLWSLPVCLGTGGSRRVAGSGGFADGPAGSMTLFADRALRQAFRPRFSTEL